MSNDGYVQVPADSVGKKIDASSLTVGPDMVIRQRIVLADSSNPTGLVTVTSAGALNVTGKIDAISATVTVAGVITGIVNISATAMVRGTMSLSGIIQVSNVDPIVLAAGTDLIGAVSIAAGNANIGFLNHVSATVQVQVASRVGIDNISATVTTRMAGVNDVSSGLQVPVGDSVNSALRVNIVAGAAAGVSQLDDTSYSARAAQFVPTGGVFSETGTGASVSASHAAAFRMTGFRAQLVNLRTDGDQKVEDSANAAIRVNIVAGAAAGVSQIDDTSYSARAANFVPIGGLFNDSGIGISLSTSHAGAVRMTSFRAFHVNLRDVSGNPQDNTNPLSVKVEAVSGTASVVLAAGAANIGTVNNISATVNVVLGAGTQNIGAVSLVAGTSNIGYIDKISQTVNVALAAGTNNIGFINSISKTVSVVIAAGTANMGGVDFISRSVDVVVHGTIDNISATVTVATANPWVVATQSGSHGPSTSVFSTSPVGVVITAPGAGNFLYITMLAGTNSGTVNTNVRIGPSVSTNAVQMYCVSAGGGFVLYFDPPMRLPGNEALWASCKPNALGDVRLVMNFFVRNA